jgi:hypothetical protein
MRVSPVDLLKNIEAILSKPGLKILEIGALDRPFSQQDRYNVS